MREYQVSKQSACRPSSHRREQSRGEHSRSHHARSPAWATNHSNTGDPDQLTCDYELIESPPRLHELYAHARDRLYELHAHARDRQFADHPATTTRSRRSTSCEHRGRPHDLHLHHDERRWSVCALLSHGPHPDILFLCRWYYWRGRHLYPDIRSIYSIHACQHWHYPPVQPMAQFGRRHQRGGCSSRPAEQRHPLTQVWDELAVLHHGIPCGNRDWCVGGSRMSLKYCMSYSGCDFRVPVPSFLFLSRMSRYRTSYALTVVH